MAATVNAGGNSTISPGVLYDSKLYFAATQNSLTGRELYTYDGSSVDLVADINPTPNASGSPENLTVCNNILYFQASDDIHGRELWRMGTASSVQSFSFPGTVQLYPNPSTSKVTIALDLSRAQNLSIVIMDALGNLIWQGPERPFSKGKSSVVISVEKWCAGPFRYILYDRDKRICATGTLLRS